MLISLGHFYSLNYKYLGSPQFWNGAQEFCDPSQNSPKALLVSDVCEPPDKMAPGIISPALVLLPGSMASVAFCDVAHGAELLYFGAFTCMVRVEM